MAAVDALLRMQLAARRNGCRLHLSGVSPALLALISLCGLESVLPLYDGRALREAEEREQALGVEERVQARDPPV